jgi:ABC-2 type transport system permease protein
MSTPSNAVPEPPMDSQGIESAAMSATRPFYWSVRRELWENRSIYIAPLAVAGVALLGFLVSAVGLPKSVREVPTMEPVQQQIALAIPYAHVAMLLAVIAFIVGVFYCLDALYGERRDRSILFWKSLPVSDRTTVLSKACIPLVVLPLLVLALTIGVQFIMLVLGSIVLLVSGVGVGTMWSRLPLVQMEFGLLYSLIVIALWHAPLYAWLLLISGWARRAVFLWAVLPLAGLAAFERIAFHTSHFGLLLRDRLFGFAEKAFEFKMPDGTSIDPHFIPLTQFTPGKFLSSPGLWFGLVLAAAFLAAALRLRRYREPI